jgi:hypothetical protein
MLPMRSIGNQACAIVTRTRSTIAFQANVSTFARRSLRRYVESGGYLIVGAYGSRSRGVLPADVSALLRLADLPVAGEASVGSPVVATFAWVAA